MCVTMSVCSCVFLYERACKHSASFDRFDWCVRYTSISVRFLSCCPLFYPSIIFKCYPVQSCCALLFTPHFSAYLLPSKMLSSLNQSGSISVCLEENYLYNCIWMPDRWLVYWHNNSWQGDINWRFDIIIFDKNDQ